MLRPDWKGVYPALLTPFKADDSIDFDMFRLNGNAQLDAGIDAMIIGGSLGEASTLSKEEIFALLQFAKQHLNRKVPVIVNIAEQSTQVATAFARDIENKGADGLMVLPPMRYKADERETVQYFKKIAGATSLPIMIYNNPYDYKIEVTLDMFRELAEMPNIQAVKESTRDVSNVTRMKNRFGDRFRILCGVALDRPPLFRPRCRPHSNSRPLSERPTCGGAWRSGRRGLGHRRPVLETTSRPALAEVRR